MELLSLVHACRRWLAAALWTVGGVDQDIRFGEMKPVSYDGNGVLLAPVCTSSHSVLSLFVRFVEPLIFHRCYAHTDVPIMFYHTLS